MEDKAQQDISNIPNEDTSTDAYAGCMCEEDWYTGFVFTVESEQIVGMAGPWPVAVTAERGELHGCKTDPRLWEGTDACPEWAAAMPLAIAVAKAKGWPLAAWVLDTQGGA